jgi:thiol-disulfide isomerase/thioredoxin
MKKPLLFLSLLLCFVLNGFAQSSMGFIDIDKVEASKEFSWFRDGYASYEPDKLTLDSMVSLPSNYKILVFGGTWCSDTRDLLPKLYKCSDQVNVSRADISVYLLDEKKTSPEGLEKKYNVTNVPTFIVLKDGKEKGRITESVNRSIEKDLLTIMR